MSKHTSYEAELKLQVVLEVEKTLTQICREYEVAADLVCHWRDVFLERAPQVFADPRTSSKGATDEQRIVELERMVGRLTMELDALKSLEAAILPCEQRREIVRRLTAAYPVQTLCELLELPPSIYYYRWLAGEELELREAV